MDDPKDQGGSLSLELSSLAPVCVSSVLSLLHGEISSQQIPPQTKAYCESLHKQKHFRQHMCNGNLI